MRWRVRAASECIAATELRLQRQLNRWLQRQREHLREKSVLLTDVESMIGLRDLLGLHVRRSVLRLKT